LLRLSRPPDESQSRNRITVQKSQTGSRRRTSSIRPLAQRKGNASEIFDCQGASSYYEKHARTESRDLERFGFNMEALTANSFGIAGSLLT
jgi:hypothetical protein